MCCVVKEKIFIVIFCCGALVFLRVWSAAGEDTIYHQVYWCVLVFFGKWKRDDADNGLGVYWLWMRDIDFMSPRDLSAFILREWTEQGKRKE